MRGTWTTSASSTPTIRPVHEVRDGLGRGELLAALADGDTPDHRISIRSELAVDREPADGRGTEQLLMPVWIESRGGMRRGRTGDWWTDGDAGVSLGSVTPFVYAEAGDGSLVERPDVRANVDRLRGLVRAAIGVLRPQVARVHTESGEPFPFNAHLAYFATTDGAKTPTTTGQPVLALPQRFRGRVLPRPARRHVIALPDRAAGGARSGTPAKQQGETPAGRRLACVVGVYQ
jgi:hypothetical protein